MFTSQDQPLEDYFTKLQSIIVAHHNNNKSEEDLRSLNEMLIGELELCRDKAKSTETQVANLLEVCNTDSATQYIELRETQKRLREENKDLKEEIENLKMSFTEQRMTLNQTHTELLNTKEEEHKQELKKITEELKLMSSQFARREHELYNEIQVLQAASAIQCDELQTKYMHQLVEANTKLREANISRSVLQKELYDLKVNSVNEIFELRRQLRIAGKIMRNFNINSHEIEQMQHKINHNEANISEHSEAENVGNSLELENQEHSSSANIHFTNNQSNIPDACNNSYNKDANSEKNNVNVGNEKSKSKENQTSKYPPLQVTSKPSDNDNFFELDDFESGNVGLSLPSKKTLPTVYKGYGSKSYERNVVAKTTSRRNNNLPPLKQCSDAKNKKDDNNLSVSCGNKKRRLFNPNDLEYLENLDE